jgi:hypothetical protein
MYEALDFHPQHHKKEKKKASWCRGSSNQLPDAGITYMLCVRICRDYQSN